MSGVVKTLARLRVPLGFAFALAVFWWATPTAASLLWGAFVAALGEALRIWAAGHLIKSNEVTSSGPYRWFAHPLYVGSGLLGAGLAIASASLIVSLLIAIYLAATIGAAVRSEEAFLRGRFGDQYEAWRRGRATSPEALAAASRRFSLARAMANREYRAVAGVVAAMLLLLLKRSL